MKRRFLEKAYLLGRVEPSMLTLGIESSCDETSASVVGDDLRVHSNVVFSQISQHQAYGGVVPEIASRCHVEAIPEVIGTALQEAGAEWSDLKQIAVTQGPGLASSLLIGTHTATALSQRLEIPLVDVNHLAGHVYSLFLNRRKPTAEELPMLILLVSGGHTLLLSLDERGELEQLGTTLDDAAGEALDKGAKLMGLGYPGGPIIESMAETASGEMIRLASRQRLKATRRTGALNPDFCFSFSGLKTALLYHLKDHPEDGAESRIPNLCAGYQEDVVQYLLDPVRRVLKSRSFKTLGCVGGVARNRRLRAGLEGVAQKAELPLILTDTEFCTDNAAMIASAAICGAGIPREAGLLWKDVKPNWPLGQILG